MAYPEEIIDVFTQQYPLQNPLLEKFRKILLIDGMQEAIEGGALVPIHLFYGNAEPMVLLSEEKAMMLMDVYKKICSLQSFLATPQALSKVFQWAVVLNEPYVYVLTPESAQQVLEDPSFLNSLNELLIKHPKEEKQWDEIKTQLYHIEQIQEHRERARQIKSSSKAMIVKLLPLAGIIASNPLIQNDYIKTSTKLSQYMNISVDELQQTAEQYFRDIYAQQNKTITKIEFLPKGDGVQLGSKMRISYREGFGPKVHFFANSLSIGDFFIATQDANFTKIAAKNKTFFTYEHLRDNRRLQSDAETCKGISCMDILSRVFRLHDVTTNPSNFGKVNINDTSSKWKIIDFRINNEDTYGYDDIFGGFLAGNGRYNYQAFLVEIIKDRPETDRIETASQVMHELTVGRVRLDGNGHKMPLLDAITRAYEQITTYMNGNAAVFGSAKAKDNTLQDLTRYANAVRTNFLELNDKIQKRHKQGYNP